MRLFCPDPARAFFLIYCLFALACGEEPDEHGGASMAVDTLSFLALGDSYTVGESVDSLDRWPVQLSQALTERGVPTEEPSIVARTGWTTDELAAGIREAEINETFDLVSLLIGVNNQYRGRSPEEYRDQFRDLLLQAIEFAGGDPERVLVLSIPDWGVMPFAEGRDRGQIADGIDAFNQINREESLAAGVSYLDITGISREAASDSGLVAEDGLHPSGKMYTQWVEAALPILLGGFGGSPGL